MRVKISRLIRKSWMPSKIQKEIGGKFEGPFFPQRLAQFHSEIRMLWNLYVILVPSKQI
jgi:hypothetical protein